MSLPLSAVRRAGPFVVVSGQIGRDSNESLPASPQDQTRVVIANVARHLETQGLGLADVIKTTVFLTSMDDSAVMNEEYRDSFPDPFPARSTVEVSRLPVDAAVVEIEAWAIDPDWLGRQATDE